MIALYIISAVILVFAVLLLGWIRITVVYDDQLKLKAGYLFLSFTLFPKKQKRINPKKFTYSKFRRMRLKEEKAIIKEEKQKNKKKKGEKNAPEKQEDEKSSKTGMSASEAICFVKEVVFKIIGKFSKLLRIDISEFKIKVASPDPAQTAVEYGVVSQTVEYILLALSNLKHTRFTRNAVVDVRPDFVSDKPEIAVKIRFRLRLAHLISLAFSALSGYISYKQNSKDS